MSFQILLHWLLMFLGVDAVHFCGAPPPDDAGVVVTLDLSGIVNPQISNGF